MKYYRHDNALYRQKTPTSCPEVYFGVGKWQPHPDPQPIHEGSSMSEAEARAYQAAQDKPRAAPRR